MINSEPSAIVFQGIPRIRGLYKFRFEWRPGLLRENHDAIGADAHVAR